MEIFYISLLPDHTMDYISDFFTKRNRVTSIFKSNQTRESIPRINSEN